LLAACGLHLFHRRADELVGRSEDILEGSEGLLAPATKLRPRGNLGRDKGRAVAAN
jgi:hypothetical protein